MNVENEDFPINSYYPMQNVANNPYYRPYDTTAEEWAYSTNANGVFAGSIAAGMNNLGGTAGIGGITGIGGIGALGGIGSGYNRNLYSDYENAAHWQLSESAALYQHLSNSNMWGPMYAAHNYDNYHDYRFPVLPEPIVDESNVPSYDFNVDNVPGSEPSVSNNNNSCSNGGSHPVEQGVGAPSFNVAMAYTPILVPSDPGRQLVNPSGRQDATFQCDLCLRYCVSAGGLKRHSKFCRASEANLETIFASLKRSNSDADNNTSSSDDDRHDDGNSMQPINLTAYGKSMFSFIFCYTMSCTHCICCWCLFSQQFWRRRIDEF